METDMKASGLKTLELARIYESQGHFRDAYDIYSFLDRQSGSPETAAGLARMKSRLEKLKTGSQVSYPDLVIDTDLLEDSLGSKERSERTVNPDSGAMKKDSRTHVQRLMDQWLHLVMLEKQLGELRQL